MLQRIESIQFKTDLKLKLENPFGVQKGLINFSYENFVNVLKQNLGISKNGLNLNNIDNIFRFITEQLFIILSNEINFQFGYFNFGQDTLIPLLTNSLVLSLIGKNKIEENIFDFIQSNIYNLTNSDEKITIFYLIKELLDLSYTYLYQKKNILKYGIVGNTKSGKTTFINRVVTIPNINSNINYYKKTLNNNFILFIDFKFDKYNSFFINNYLNNLNKKIYILDITDNIKSLWINFIRVGNWNKKNFFKLLSSFLKIDNIEYSKNDIYFINKTDLIQLNELSIFNVKKLKNFILKISDYVNLNSEEIHQMNKNELIHLINFVIRCGNHQNIFWGSLYNGTNLNKFKQYLNDI